MWEASFSSYSLSLAPSVSVTDMKPHLHLTDSHYRIHSAGSDAFGPKIVSADNLPGTPMDHRSSMEDDLNRTPTADLEVPHFLNGVGGGSCTRLVVKNELSERRRSLEYVNRPPSPSHFIQFTAKKNEPQQFTDESPLTSPKDHNHNSHHSHNQQPLFNRNNQNGVPGSNKEEKSRGSHNYSQDNLSNGIMPHGSTVNLGNHSNGGRDKESDKEVGLLYMVSSSVD